MIPTRLPITNQNYAHKARLICHRAARAYGHASPDSVPPLALVEHLIGRKHEIAKNTWKQYKCAMRHHIHSLLTQTQDGALAEELQAALQMLDSTSSEGTLKYGTQTSAKKQKKFKRADRDKLLAYLERQIGKHRYARSLLLWIKASRLTGLRPSEWEHASVDTRYGRIALTVRNAKATNGRGNGFTRSLDLSRVSQEDLQTIREMVDMVEGYRAELPFEELQIRIGKYMQYATRRCFGKRHQYPTLYSLRHQFAADAKFGGARKNEVAALLGQASDETAGNHYARRVSGEDPIVVAPFAAEVERVRARARTFIRKRQPSTTDEA